MGVQNPSYVGLRNELLKHIQGFDNKILDVGCSNGVNGNYLLNEGIAITVYGIEYNSELAKSASKNNLIVYEGDLNDLSFKRKLDKILPSFDYIIFGDILEHLYAPQEVLADLVKKLKPDGKVIISLPNIAHVELFIQVFLKGRWPQNSRGIFDKTHLRWFTKKDTLDLVDKAGLKVISYTPELRARDAIGSKFNWKLNFVRMLNEQWVTFQHILVCEHAE